MVKLKNPIFDGLLWNSDQNGMLVRNWMLSKDPTTMISLSMIEIKRKSNQNYIYVWNNNK